MKAWKKALLAGAVAVAAGGSARAAPGFTIEETVTGGKAQRRVTYLSESAVRTEEGDKVSILSLGDGGLKLLELSPRKQEATDNSAMAPMMLMGWMTFLEKDGQGGVRARRDFYTPTEERKAVGTWSARKLTATVMGFPAEYWFTRDSKELLEAERLRARFFGKANAAMMRSQPGAPPEAVKAADSMLKAIDEFSERTLKEHGAAVVTVAKLGGMSTTYQVVSVKSASHPAELFAVPRGYKLVQGGFGGK